VRVDPPAGLLIPDRRVPARDPALLERRVAGQLVYEPADAQRAGVVDRDPPLEMTDVKAVRPQAYAPGRPELVVLRGVGADPPVDEPVVEFIEPEPGVRRRPRTVLSAEHH